MTLVLRSSDTCENTFTQICRTRGDSVNRFIHRRACVPFTWYWFQLDMVSINSEMLHSMLRHRPPRRAATIVAAMPSPSSPWGQSRAIWASEIRIPPALGKNHPPTSAWRHSVTSSSMVSRSPPVRSSSLLIPKHAHGQGFQAIQRKDRHATAAAQSSDFDEATKGDRPGSDPKPQYESPPWLQRTQLLVGDEGLRRLHQSRVLLVGLGGVGSYAAEFLVRWVLI